MTRFVGTPLRGIEFSSPSDESFSTRVNLDAHARIRIDAGGRLTWSSGSAAGDTNLYRLSANTLYTDDIFQAALGLVTVTSLGAPVSSLPDGALAVDTTNNKFYFRSNSAWQEVGGAGLLSGDVDGGILSPDIHEAEVTNYVLVGFDGGTL
jgi:hypothetical protein